MVFKLTILGTSSALPTSKRYPSAHVLNVHERIFLIDCGEGTQMRMRQVRINIGKINNIFISHSHGDHVFGLYGLLSTLNLIGRSAPLTLYAPENFGPMLISHLADFDINLEYELRFVPLRGKNPIKIFEDTCLTVTSFPLKHRIPTYGFIFREKQLPRNIKKSSIKDFEIPLASISGIKQGDDFVTREGRVIANSEITIDPRPTKAYAYCSDTAYFKRLSAIVKGVDLLYHEATFASDKTKLARETGHSTASEAATVARDAEVGRLIIGHFSSRYKEVDRLLQEARAIFAETFAGEEGESYQI